MRRKLPLLGFAIGFALEAGLGALCFIQNPGPFGCPQALAICGLSVAAGLVGALLGFALRGAIWAYSAIMRHKLPNTASHGPALPRRQ